MSMTDYRINHALTYFVSIKSGLKSLKKLFPHYTGRGRRQAVKGASSLPRCLLLAKLNFVDSVDSTISATFRETESSIYVIHSTLFPDSSLLLSREGGCLFPSVLTLKRTQDLLRTILLGYCAVILLWPVLQYAIPARNASSTQRSWTRRGSGTPSFEPKIHTYIFLV